MNQHLDTKPIYSVLAPLYDYLMRDVDYEAWADYIDDLIQLHSPYSERLLELACGTGSISLSLDELGYYRITGTDLSGEMIRVARKKAKVTGSDMKFLTMDFLNIDIEDSFDVVFLVFDSINYLHNSDEILRLHDQVRRVIRPGGLFIFDFTTPSHSRAAIHYLDGEEGTVDNQFHFHQKSHFDETSRIHTNHFRIELLGPEGGPGNERFEEHRQRAWTLEEMGHILDKTEFTTLNRYDGFLLEPAHEQSYRITIVSQCLKTT